MCIFIIIKIIHDLASGYSSSLDTLVYRIDVSIFGKDCLLTSIEDKRQTLPEIKVHARLFGTLENQFNSIQEFGSLVKIFCAVQTSHDIQAMYQQTLL